MIEEQPRKKQRTLADIPESQQLACKHCEKKFVSKGGLDKCDRVPTQPTIGPIDDLDIDLYSVSVCHHLILIYYNSTWIYSVTLGTRGWMNFNLNLGVWDSLGKNYY